MRNLLSKAAKYRAEARRRKLWQRAVSLLVCVVVFVTTYAQILPAIALEADLFEPDGHVHTDECYKIVKTEEKTELDCPLELHTHTAACYDADGALSCGYADFVVHTHDSNCYDENGKLVCTLPEIEEHTHTALCYPVQVDDPAAGTGSTGAAHVHTDECYTETPGALVCGEEETDGHTHTEDCYVETEQLVCELEESEGHTHTDLCMDAEGLPELCGLEESKGHTHDESCYETVRELVCEQEEAEPHTHTEDCYAPAEKELTCGFEESESEEKSEGTEETEETPDPFAGEDEDLQPICGQEEIELHTHTAACFGAGGAVVCGQIEVLEHQHTEDCLRVVQEASEEKVLDCAYTSSEDKADDEKPADSSTGKDEEKPADSSAGEDKDGEKPADSDSTGEKPANSGSEKPADSGSTGGDKDGSEETDKDGKTPTDGTTAPSDPDDAPVLTPATLAERVLAAAESYIGYKEDAEDCDIDADGETRGLTQFGLHYGMPYEKWDAMFVAYCLEEAGAEELPSAADCLFDIDVWASMLDGAGYCQTAELYTPAPGDVAFFDLDGDGTLDHVAFVEKVTDTRLFVIAGDSNDCVRRASYARADESVVGYGVLPRDEDEPQDSPADEPDEDEGAAGGGLTGEPSEDETEDDPAASDPMDEPQDGEDGKTDEKDPDKPDEDGKTDKAGEGDKTAGKDDDKKNEDTDQDSTQEAALGLAGRVLAAAQAEFGYTSAPDGTTLYRAFYDDSTAPLDVLFVAYCLDRAGIEGVPSAQDSGFDSEQWRAALAEAGMFRAAGAEEAVPAPGEVLFLDKDGDGAADFVAIVEKVAGGKVHVLEMAEAPAVAVAALALDMDEENGGETMASAAASCVRRVAYSLTDTQVLGYTALASLEDEDTALTEEEQAQVDAVIALIDALPDQETLTQKMAELNETGDEDAADAYLTELRTAAIAAYKAYEKLTEEQQKKVTNAEKLLALEWLWSAETPTDDSEAAVWAELAERGIYPGTAEDKNNPLVWTVYDAATAANANIKATVTLPAGTTVPEGYYLYIRKVNKDEGYYPNEDALKAAVGDEGVYSDVQCYAIHWVHVYEENGEWKYELTTNSVLQGTGSADDSAPKATVQIEYLNGAKLQGSSAHRKLIVFNSRNAEGTDLEDASTPTAVTATNTAYTGFTFETNRGGPYVFVSKTLFEGYVSSLTIDSMTDGSGPFDTGNEAGNDSANNNGIVRSYDVIEYNLTANLGARSNTVTATKARLWFEATMQADIMQAVFDPSKMLWMDDNYTIEYLDKDGNVVLTQTSNSTATDLNKLASGSEEKKTSYTTEIASQRLRVYMDVEAEQNLLVSNQILNVMLQVLNAGNSDTIQPTFKAWLEGNEDNYGSESPGEGDGVTLAQKVTENEKKAEEVKVSAAARFNLELSKNSNMSYKSWFDSSNGKEVKAVDSYAIGSKTVTGTQLYTLLEKLAELDENEDKANPEDFTDTYGACTEALDGLTLADYKSVFKNIRYGRITGYGITLQVYNEASENQNVASKRFKGVSLPQGDITFDLALSTLVKEVGADEKEPGTKNGSYYAQLWEYNENVTEDSGNQGHNMYWDSLASTQYAAWAAPYNTGTGVENNCYKGGKWSLTDNTFTVKGYDFNFLSSGIKFPTHKAGNSSASTGYDTYIGSFSAGYIQVLNVYPRYQSKTLTVSTDVTVKNLTVSTRDGQTISAGSDDETGYAHETNRGDNQISDNIPLYARGGMTKANAFDSAALFNNRGATFTSKTYFLGTDFWGTSYDCSAYAGQQVTLVGAARINAGDYKIRHMNILQLFDSEVLSIVDGIEPYAVSRVAGATEGTTNILYAADPDYRNGYDTSSKSVMTYMSTVREEDLIYYNSMNELQDAGYTCVGVLAELRNWFINGEGGYSTELRILMQVSDKKEFLNKTIGTVNTARIWTDEADMGNGTVTWENGAYNFSTGKNSVNGYTSVFSSTGESYRGEVANNSAYEKTEYENGQVKLGTNTGGYVYGSSLLILGYKSKVDIEVDKHSEGEKPTAKPTYDMDKADYTVKYILKDIIAETDDPAGKAQATQTNLTVLSKPDAEKKEEDDDSQRITIAAGSYYMVPASDQMKLTDENYIDLEAQSVKISEDPYNPTQVYYKLWNQEKKAWDNYAILVYAQRETKGSQVTFELKSVTLDVSVPNIIYDAVIDPIKVENNDTITAAACISGTSDVRAYSTTAGNMDEAEIGIIRLGSTRLAKSVNTEYIELNGEFEYTVTYTNTGNSPINIYLYDLMPITNDIRGSEYTGTARLTKIETEGANDVQLYYSTVEYEKLYNKVKLFGAATEEGEKSVEEIKKLLEDGNWFKPLNATDLASVEPTGIYAVVNGLAGNQSFKIKLTVKTDQNNAGDLYRNIANSWLGDNSAPLTSNRVETTVLSRAISGVVWYDKNLNGVRDEDEPLISDVTCTLFKLDEDKKSDTYGKYVACTTDVTGGTISTVTTGNDGTYSFNKLAAGKYIVAFSGDALSKYNGATTYRVNGTNDTMTNDAVALGTTESVMDRDGFAIDGISAPGNTYKYAIAYDLATPATVGSTTLHTIDDIVKGNIPLTNSVELYANLDCGLVTVTYVLPHTGDTGTTLYTAGGLTALGIGMLLLYKREKRRKEASASS